VDARPVESTVTLYRVGVGGQNPTQGVVSIGTPAVIGVGGDGGTTYFQSAARSVMSTAVASPASLVSIFAYTTGINDVYVEKNDWVYQSAPDSSHFFNTLDQNCTLPGTAPGGSSLCVEIDRQVVGNTTTASTTTYNAPAVPWYTFTMTSTILDVYPSARSAAGHLESIKWFGSLPLLVIALLTL